MASTATVTRVFLVSALVALCAAQQLPTAVLTSQFRNDASLGIDHVFRVTLDITDYYTTAGDASQLFVRLEPLANSLDTADTYGPCFIPANFTSSTNLLNATISNSAATPTNILRPLRVIAVNVGYRSTTQYATSVPPVYRDVNNTARCVDSNANLCPSSLSISGSPNNCTDVLARSCRSCWSPDYFICRYGTSGYNNASLIARYPSRPVGYVGAWPPLNPSAPKPVDWPSYYTWPPSCGFSVIRPNATLWPDRLPWPPVSCQADTVLNRTLVTAIVEIDLLRARAICPGRISSQRSGQSDSYRMSISAGYRNDDALTNSRQQFYTSRAYTCNVENEFTSTSWSTTSSNNAVTPNTLGYTGGSAVVSIRRVVPVLLTATTAQLMLTYRFVFTDVTAGAYVRVGNSTRFTGSTFDCYGLSFFSNMSDADAQATCRPSVPSNGLRVCEQEVTVITTPQTLTADGLAFQRTCPASPNNGGVYAFGITFQVATTSGSLVSSRMFFESVTSYVAISVYPSNEVDTTVALSLRPAVGFVHGLTPCVRPVTNVLSLEQLLTTTTIDSSYTSTNNYYYIVGTSLMNATAAGGASSSGRVMFDTYFSVADLAINGALLSNLLASYSAPELSDSFVYEPRTTRRMTWHDQICDSNCQAAGASTNGLNCDAFAFSTSAIQEWIERAAPGQGGTAFPVTPGSSSSSITISGTVFVRAYFSAAENASIANMQRPGRRLLSINEHPVQFVVSSETTRQQQYKEQIQKTPTQFTSMEFTNFELHAPSPLSAKYLRVQRSRSLYSWSFFGIVSAGIISVCCVVMFVSNRRFSPALGSTKWRDL